MRHGQGFEQVLQEWLRQAPHGPTGRSDRPAALARYQPLHDYGPADMLDDPAQGATPQDMLAMLARLATQMHLGSLRVADAVGTLPAGYTYLAQFAVHDLVNSDTLRPTAHSNQASVPFGNTQSPSLDLASLYGAGPAGNPALFVPVEETGQRGRFRLGWMRDGDGRPTVAEDIPRIPMGPCTGEAEGDQRLDPLLADTRNADNLILSQLVVVFMQAHNRLYDLASRHAATGQARHPLFARPFEAARCMLIVSYRRIIGRDLLPRLLPGGIWPPQQTAGPQPVSAEAALAVLRFGHALIQPRYDFNAVHSATGASGPATIERLMDFFGLRPSRDLPVDDSWVIDWQSFLTEPGSGPVGAVNMARPLGPTLAEPLRRHPAIRVPAPDTVPGLAGYRLGLAFRTMAKGMMAGLPTGQALATRLVADGRISAADVLPQAVIEQGLRDGRTAACIGERCLTDADIAAFAVRTPLFYYVLEEARHFGAGARLGPVGGHVLARTCAAALAGPVLPDQPYPDAAADALWLELGRPGRTDLPETLPALVALARGTG